MDIVAPLVDGRVLTGEVKWNTAPLEPKWHYHHMAMLERLRAAGQKWAHDAAKPEAPLIWVAAGGFTPEFEVAVRSEREEVYLWTLADLYSNPEHSSSQPPHGVSPSPRA